MITIRAAVVRLLSSTYWHYRRQGESHLLSAYWGKAVVGLIGMIWGLAAWSLLFHTATIPRLGCFSAVGYGIPLLASSDLGNTPVYAGEPWRLW
jgi:hypothetical protein